MFMIHALFYMLIAISIASLSILGYQYTTQGYGLHPLLCIAVCFILVVLHLWFIHLTTPKYTLVTE